MKKLFLFLTLFAWAMMAMTMVTGSALALTIDTGAIDVGSIDDLIAQARLSSSGEAVELAWVNSVLGGTYVFTDKTEVEGDDWSLVDNETGVYAHGLSNPDHFLIKTGNVTTGDVDRHFLFDNLAALNWAVIDLEEMGFTNILNIAGVSHISEFDGAPVPEPATILLLGSGLVGLASFGRRKFKK